MNKKKWDTSRTVCNFFTEHRVLRCFPMSFYIAFYSDFEKHVLCFSCPVNPSRLKHQIVGSRYRRCCIWCTRNAISYPSMALGKAFPCPLSLSFPPIHLMGHMGIIRINIFPESFCWRVLARLCQGRVGRVLSLRRIAAASIFHWENSDKKSKCAFRVM